MNARIARASGTGRPRICSATSWALRGAVRTYFASARTGAGFSATAISDHLASRSRFPRARSEHRKDAHAYASKDDERLRTRPRTQRGDASQQRGEYEM